MLLHGTAFLCVLRLLLSPFLISILPCFQAFLIRLFGDNLQRIGSRDECAGAVGTPVLELQAQRILVDKGCVAEPVGQGVGVDGRLKDKGIVGVEVQSFDLRQLTVAIGEEKGEMVGLRAVGFLEIPVCQRLGESAQQDVVWIEMRVGNAADVLDMQ